MSEAAYPVSETEAARRIGVAPATLRKWRTTGFGPAYLKVSRTVVYAPAEIERFLADCVRKSTSDRRAAA